MVSLPIESWGQVIDKAGMPLADIHRMTGLFRLSFARIGHSGKIEPWKMASPVRQSRDVCPLLAENVVFTFFRA